jgi:transposase
MANELKMDQRQAIIGLWRLGWSHRRIAAELGIDRETVSRHVRSAARAEAGGCGPPVSSGANAAISITGSTTLAAGDSGMASPASSADAALPEESNAAISITGSTALAAGDSTTAFSLVPVGRRSLCEPLRAEILAGLDKGLTARRIWQDLRDGQGFAGDYQSVQRFVRRLGDASPLPFRRMECEPGAEAQIDFGRGAPIVTPEGKRSRPHLFRIVLSHSRKAYSEAAPRQTTELFLRCIENAFWRLGGVPKTLVVDNLKAAVLRGDWFDPELNPKIISFCRHYGTVLLPTRPRMPRHKGKIEAGVKYGQSNAVKGRVFASLAEQNLFLAQWEASVADQRIHGTTRKQVAAAFEAEKPALLPLPPERFPCFQEARRIVSRDGHVEVAKAYYSAPPEFVGRTIWARWDSRIVRLFDEGMNKQIALHARREPGTFATAAVHIAPAKRSGLERGAQWWLGKAHAIGPHAGQWAASTLEHRGIHALRVVMGLVSLTHKHSADRIEQACRCAASHGAYRLRDIRNLLQRATPAAEQRMLPFLEQHPVIRPLSEYDKIIQTSFDQTPTSPSSK